MLRNKLEKKKVYKFSEPNTEKKFKKQIEDLKERIRFTRWLITLGLLVGPCTSLSYCFHGIALVDRSGNVFNAALDLAPSIWDILVMSFFVIDATGYFGLLLILFYIIIVEIILKAIKSYYKKIINRNNKTNF